MGGFWRRSTARLTAGPPGGEGRRDRVRLAAARRAGPCHGDSRGSRRRVGTLAGGVAAAVLLVLGVLAGRGLAPIAGIRPVRALAAASAASAGVLHQVPGVLPGLSLATGEGAAPASRRLRIGVSVQLPDPAGEQRLLAALYDPASPQYHRFLTPAQFDARFGLPAVEVGAIRSWLTGGGLHVDTVSGSGGYLTATGTVGALDRLFRVTVGRYRFGGRQFLANDVAPSVPADLPVAAIVGLNTLARFSPAPLTAPPGPGASQPAGTGSAGTGPANLTSSATAGLGGATRTGSALEAAGGGVQGVLTPQDLWGVYDDPGAHDAALTAQSGPSAGVSDAAALERTRIDFGQGQTIGIFGEGETSSVVAQLRLFEHAMGLPKVPVRVVHTEGGPRSAYGDNSGSIEWYLDSQASTGMAPDVSQLDLYFAKSLADADVFASFAAWAGDPHGPSQMNASFGECEANPTNPVTGPLAQQPYGTELGDELEAVGDPILEQATLEGRTLFAAAGDTGSGCPEVVAPVVGAGNGVAVQPVPLVNYPCASPYAVCVGGTVVSVDGASYPAASERAAETSWTFGGGGASHFIPAPAYQRQVANIDQPCLSTPQGDLYPPTDAPTCRGVPDVADMSGNVTGDGYFIYVDGTPSSEGGTSLSSPLMVGQWARVQAGAPAAVRDAGGLGFADPTIYAQAAGADACSASDTGPCTSTPYTSEFFDVTQSEYGVGNGAYRPGPGWDYTSGWGVMNVTPFMQTVDGTLTPTNNVLPPTPSGGSGPQLACGDLWQNPTHTATGGPQSNPEPQLTLDAGTMGLNQAGSAPVLEVTLQVQNLSTHVPTGATGEDWYATWTYGNKEYFAYAHLSVTPTSTPTYGDGTATKTGTTTNYAPVNTDTGSFNQGPNGTIVIDVPLTNVGSPPLGAVLLHPAAVTFTEEGTPSTSQGGSGVASLQQVDTGGPDLNYTVGGVIPCSGASPGGTVPESPWAPLLPILGLAILLGSGVGVRRLRRLQLPK